MRSAVDLIKQKLAEAGFEVLPPNPEMTLQLEYVLFLDDQGRQQAVYISPKVTNKFGLDFVSLAGISYLGPKSGLKPENYLLVSEEGANDAGFWSWQRCGPEIIGVGYCVNIPLSDRLDAKTVREIVVEIGTYSDNGEQILTGGGDRF